MTKLQMGSNVYLQFDINETDTLAGTAYEAIAPVDGFIHGLDVIVQKAVTTGGAVTVEVNTVAVAGLSVTVADAATKGTRYSDAPTSGSSTQAVSKGDRITITPASAFATAGAINGYVTINTGGLYET